MTMTKSTDLHLIEINGYLDYLCSKVNINVDGKYSKLIRHLQLTPFRHLEMDVNRAVDGTDLRLIFSDETNLYPKIQMMMVSDPCSVLEMLVALAVRVGTYSFSNPPNIFWTALLNIGLCDFDDEHYDQNLVDSRLIIFMERQYDEFGNGGCAFPNPNPREDLRNVDIWYQLMWYYPYLE